jgi:hypothetical protein
VLVTSCVTVTRPRRAVGLCQGYLRPHCHCQLTVNRLVEVVTPHRLATQACCQGPDRAALHTVQGRCSLDPELCWCDVPTVHHVVQTLAAEVLVSSRVTGAVTLCQGQLSPHRHCQQAVVEKVPRYLPPYRLTLRALQSGRGQQMRGRGQVQPLQAAAE